jgi:hypothetical protein
MSAVLAWLGPTEARDVASGEVVRNKIRGGLPSGAVREWYVVGAASTHIGRSE